MNTDEKIIKAATNEFAMFGYDGARIDNIAKKAKVNKAMIYYHYKGKESLYEKVITELYQKVFGIIVQESNSNDNPREQILHMIDDLVDFFCAMEDQHKKIILWEFASGGRFLRKHLIDKMIKPVFGIIQETYGKAEKLGLINNLHPQFTQLTLVGGSVFINIIKLMTAGTDINKQLFPADYSNTLKENIHEIFFHGIACQEEIKNENKK